MKWLYTKLVLIIALGIILAAFFYALIFKFDLDKLPAVHVPVMFSFNKIFWLDDVKSIYSVLINKEKMNKADAVKLIKDTYKEQLLIEQIAKKENIKSIPLNDTKALGIETEKLNADKLSNELFGWSIDKFKKLIIEPLELKRGVVDWFYKQNNISIKQKLEDQKKELSNVSDIQKLSGYEYFGFIDLKSLPPIIQITVLSLKPNSISDVIETQDEYHLIYLQSTIPDKNLYEVGVLSVKKHTFSKWIEDNIKNIWLFSLVK